MGEQYFGPTSLRYPQPDFYRRLCNGMGGSLRPSVLNSKALETSAVWHQKNTYSFSSREQTEKEVHALVT